MTTHRSTIGPLAPGTVFFYRLSVSNEVHAVLGPLQRFITGGKLVVWSGEQKSIADENPGLSDVVSIASGSDHNLAVRLNGTVYAWGANDSGQTTVPVGLTNIVQGAAGGRHSLALKGDGTVVAWGGNNLGQCNVPIGLNDVVAIAAGETVSMALKSNGQLVQWGNPAVIGNTPETATNLVSISVVGNSVLAATQSGKMVTWGPIETPYFFVFEPPQLSNAVAVARGVNLAAAIDANGSVFGWGVGTAFQAHSVVSNAVSAAAGHNHFAVLDEAGCVHSFGANTLEQVFFPLDVVDAVEISAAGNRTIALVPNLPPVVAADHVSISAGDAAIIRLNGHDPSGDSLMLRVVAFPTNGVLRQWSNGSPGELLDPEHAIVTDPNRRLFFVPTSPLMDDGQEVLRFVASDGELESTPAAISLVPAKAPFATTLPSKLTGATGQFLLQGFATPNGIAASAWFEWGLTRQYGNRTTAVQLPAVHQVQMVSTTLDNLSDGRAYFFRLAVSNAAGTTFGMEQALVTGGSVVAWGSGGGVGTFPTGPGNVVGLSANNFQSLLLEKGGTASTSGAFPIQSADRLISSVAQLCSSDNELAVLNWSGQFQYQSAVFPEAQVSLLNFRDIPVSVGIAEQSRIALLADGRVQALGSYISGPYVTPFGLSNVVALATRDSYGPVSLARPSFAVFANGSVVSFNNLDGTTRLHPEITNAVTVSTRDNAAALLLSDGSIQRWNGTDFVELTGSSKINDAFALATSSDRIVAARRNGTIAVWPDDGSSIATVDERALGAVQVAAGLYHVAALVPNQPLIPPQIGIGQSNLVLEHGTTTNVLAVVGGTPPFGFQWIKDDLPLLGEDSPLLSLSLVSRSHAGLYRLVVTNEADMSVSGPLNVRTIVPQRVEGPILRPDGMLEFSIADAVGGGHAQTTNLLVESTDMIAGDNTIWAPVVEGEFRFDQAVQFRIPFSTNVAQRFFRAREQ